MRIVDFLVIGLGSKLVLWNVILNFFVEWFDRLNKIFWSLSVECNKTSIKLEAWCFFFFVTTRSSVIELQ